MPNAHRECNSLRAVFEPAQWPDIGAIAGKSARNGLRTVAGLAGRGVSGTRKAGCPAYRGAIRAILPDQPRRVPASSSRRARRKSRVAHHAARPARHGYRPIHPRLPTAPGTDWNFPANRHL